MHRPALDQFLFFILDLKKYIKSEVFCKSCLYLFISPNFLFFVSRKNESLLIIPLIKVPNFCRDKMCFLSVDFRLQMLMERSLLAIVSLMAFQIFEALYINCELGSGVIRKASFLFDSRYKEYKDIGILYLSVLNVSMLQWYTYKLWTVIRLCLFNKGLVCSFS